MAFLVPTVDALLRGPARANGAISTLIISPTRELASQIAVEAQGIVPQGFKVVTCYGQTNVKADVRNLAGGADILVGTPGRLNDLISNCASPRSSACTPAVARADPLALSLSCAPQTACRSSSPASAT